MKKVNAILLSMLLCLAMLTSCAKLEVFLGDGYGLQYDTNLWEYTRVEMRLFIFDQVVFQPVSSSTFPEQKTRTNDPVRTKMEPLLFIYEYPVSDGATALDEHFNRFVINENDTYPNFTFNGLTPVAQRQCEVRYGFTENDYETCYMCAFNTDGGSIVIECEYISDKTWSEMQKILNTLEIF